jgi:uncharacterized protein (TIGR03435 family)
MPHAGPMTIVASAVIAAFVCCERAGLAQARDPLPAFELATVKASGPGSAPMSIRSLPGGRLITSNTPLPMLIQWAYQLDDGRLLNVPKGLDALRFDVVAQAPDGPLVPGRLQQMMRALLADRFKLAVHQETRELTTYALVTEPGGPKVRATAADGPPDPNPFRMRDSGSLAGTRVTADMLAKVLSNQLGRPVENKTGFAGSFDFALQWAPDAGAPVDAAARPSMFTAIREQLGFRLDAQRATTAVVVIDRVERTPSEN